MYYFTYCDESHRKLADFLSASFLECTGKEIEIIEIPNFKEDGKPDHFKKINIILKALEKYTEVFYIDADCIITSDFDPYLPPDYNIGMALDAGIDKAPWILDECKMLGIDPLLYCNAGVMHIRQTAYAFFQNVLKLWLTKWKERGVIDLRTADQTMINYVLSIGLNDPLYSHRHVMPQLYNFMPDKCTSDTPPYIVHFAGAGTTEFKEKLIEKIFSNKQEFFECCKTGLFPYKVNQWKWHEDESKRKAEQIKSTTSI